MIKQTLITLLISIGVFAFLCLGTLPLTSSNEKNDEIVCVPLPENFKETDLVGTWEGRYFGYVDKLIIRADGTYKQIFSSDSLNFESDWQEWSFEYQSDGLGRLILAGMRRCDGTDSICDNPGGGLPPSEVAINPCKTEYISYTGEVILFVTGSNNNVPKEIVLRQAKLAGSDWSWGYQFSE